MALAQALLGLIDDEPLQQKLRTDAPRVRERFSLASVIARWDQLLEEVE